MMSILLVIAALMGAAGIALSGADVHAYPGAGLGTAGQILLFHAAAVFGLAAAIDRGLLLHGLGIAAAWGLVVGSLLFSGDVSLPIYAGAGLFPKAAPAGGIILIASWVVAALAAAIRPVRTA